MKTLALFVVAFIVTAPVIMGLAIDSLLFNVCALIWAGCWWLFFTRTKSGKKAFLRGYKMASKLMSDIDV